MIRMLPLPVTLSALGLFCGVCLAQPVPLPPAPAGVQVTRDEGYEFVTITYPGNSGFLVNDDVIAPAPDIYAGFRVRQNTSVGRVDQVYRISRTEMTGGQYGDFLNAFCAQRTITQWFEDPTFYFFGIVARTGTSAVIENGRIVRRILNRLEHCPADDLTILEAMCYCNWLQNGRPTNVSQLMQGVYDISLYLNVGSTHLFAPIPRSPDARYWIPTQDEWVKAAYFDPNRTGPSQPGYWSYPIARETPPIGGPPAPYGDGESNWGFGGYFDEHGEYIRRWMIPVVSYPTIQSPWGLFDASGGMSEVTATPLLWQEIGDETFYSWDGTTVVVRSDTNDFYFDHIAYFGVGHWPSPFGGGSWIGLRIAASVPCELRADINGDRVTDMFDYFDFVQMFSAEDVRSDYNFDEMLDLFDYLDFVQGWASGC